MSTTYIYIVCPHVFPEIRGPPTQHRGFTGIYGVECAHHCRTRAFGEDVAKKSYGLRPQWTEPPLVSLAMEANARLRTKFQVLDTKPSHFLDAGTQKFDALFLTSPLLSVPYV
jgi:hypothetical protein